MESNEEEWKNFFKCFPSRKRWKRNKLRWFFFNILRLLPSSVRGSRAQYVTRFKTLNWDFKKNMNCWIITRRQNEAQRIFSNPSQKAKSRVWVHVRARKTFKRSEKFCVCLIIAHFSFTSEQLCLIQIQNFFFFFSHDQIYPRTSESEHSRRRQHRIVDWDSLIPPPCTLHYLHGATIYIILFFEASWITWHSSLRPNGNERVVVTEGVSIQMWELEHGAQVRMKSTNKLLENISQRCFSCGFGSRASQQRRFLARWALVVICVRMLLKREEKGNCHSSSSCEPPVDVDGKRSE